MGVFHVFQIVQTVPNRAKHRIRICYQYVRIKKKLAATFLGNLRSMVTKR